MSDKFEHPTHLNVHIPEHRNMQYGVHSTNHPDSVRLSIRFNPDDRKVLEKWANNLTMDISTFIRESACNTARELERLHNAYLRSLRSR